MTEERFQDIMTAERDRRVAILPFKSDGIAMIYAGAFKVTNVESMGDETLKAVVFRVTQEESDRYDAEAASIIEANSK